MERADYDIVECLCFRKPGPKNTGAVIKSVAKRAMELGIKKVLVATCSGDTALKARDMLPEDVRVIAVSHVTGFKEPNSQEISEDAARSLEGRGVHIVTAGHAFGGVGRAFRNKTGTFQVDEIMAYTLRTLGQGVKVSAEITMMAADAGLVRTDEDVIAVGGTAKGADTAAVIRPANSAHFFDMKIREIICKPFDF